MDIDDLSISTYKSIISEVEKFNQDLTLQFGVLASSCKDDNDYLNQTEALIKDWLQVDDFEDIIDDILFGQKVNEYAFRKTVNKTLFKIAEIRKTTMKQRNLKIGDMYYH